MIRQGRCFFGLGAIALLAPVGLYWFIHNDDERYLWIIHGPYPFSHFGGGPFQAAMGLGLLLLAGLLVAAGTVLKWLMWRPLDAEFVV